MRSLSWIGSSSLLALTMMACSGASSPGIGSADNTLPEPAPTNDAPSAAQADPAAPSSTTPAAPAPVQTGPKRMFVTVQLYAGDLRAYAQGATDGFAAADAICVKEATTAKLDGTWKAFLSGRKNGTKVNAIDRIVGDGPWLAVDGKTTIFDTRASLSNEPLTEIELAADGRRYRGEGPWTGTSRGVAANDACEDNSGTSWQSAQRNVRGLTGNPDDTSEWTDADTIRCDQGAPLYCFEQ